MKTISDVCVKQGVLWSAAIRMVEHMVLGEGRGWQS